jgi:hypothetical protein
MLAKRCILIAECLVAELSRKERAFPHPLRRLRSSRKQPARLKQAEEAVDGARVNFAEHCSTLGARRELRPSSVESSDSLVREWPGSLAQADGRLGLGGGK